MELDNKDIEHIAKLARLTLTDQEIKQYRREISGIVRYINKLAEVDITKEEATTRLAEVDNALRTDLAMPWEESERQATLAQAAKQEKKQIIVPKVFDNL